MHPVRRFYCQCLLLALLCMAAIKGRANTTDPPDSTGPSIEIFTDAQWSSDSSSCTIPFSRAGNLVLVRARADTTDGNFILDTGCPHLVLNVTYFRNYPLIESPDEDKTSMAGTIEAVPQTTVRTFTLGAMKQFRLKADLVNLGHIENSRGIKVLGLIGTQLLRQYEMIIDYEKNLIYLHLISRKEASTYKHEMLNDTSAYRTVPIELTDDRIIVRSEMGGKKLRLIIDSGAESNILDSRLPDKVFENVAITGRIMLNGAGNQRVEALRGDLKNLRIGDSETGSLPVLITNLEKTCFSYSGCVDGILGFDFLSLQKIGFNFVTRKMYIWK